MKIKKLIREVRKSLGALTKTNKKQMKKWIEAARADAVDFGISFQSDHKFTIKYLPRILDEEDK